MAATAGAATAAPGNTGAEVVGADFGDNAYYEVGHKNPKVYDVRYHGVNHESMVSLPPDGLEAWSAPAAVGARDVDYHVSFSNTSNYTLIGYAKEFAKGRPHAHSKITRGAVDGTLTTSYSIGGSGTYSNSYSVSAHYAIDYWGTDSYVVGVPVVGGDLEYSGSHSAETATAVDSTQVWKDWGDWTTSSTWLNVGGAATSTYNSYVLHGTVSRNQWQEIDDSTDRSGTGTVKWSGGVTGDIGYPPPPFDEEEEIPEDPPTGYGSFTYTQTGYYEQALARGGYVSFDSEANFTRNTATPSPSLTPINNVRLIDVDYVSDLAQGNSVSNYSSHSGSAAASGYYALDTAEGAHHHYTTAGSIAQDRYTGYADAVAYNGYPADSTILVNFDTTTTYTTPFLNSVSYPQVGDPVFPSLLANAFTPALRSNLFYLAAHPELTDRRAADQMRLKDRVAPKGPGQAGEFNQLGAGDGQGNKLRVTPAGIHEGGVVPANELAAKQAGAISAESGKPLQGSHAKGLSPETIDGSFAKRTGRNSNEPQIADLGRLGGQADQKIQMIASDGALGKGSTGSIIGDLAKWGGLWDGEVPAPPTDAPEPKKGIRLSSDGRTVDGEGNGPIDQNEWFEWGKFDQSQKNAFRLIGPTVTFGIGVAIFKMIEDGASMIIPWDKVVSVLFQPGKILLRIAGSAGEKAIEIAGRPLIRLMDAFGAKTEKELAEALMNPAARNKAAKLLEKEAVELAEKEGAAIAKGATGSSPMAIPEKPSLVDPKGQKHILEGDGPGKGGGHRPGTGKPGKSEFPQGWSDGKILGEVSDIATDPAIRWTRPDRRGYITGTKTVDGVDIKVVVDTVNGRIVTGFPTNLPRNR